MSIASIKAAKRFEKHFKRFKQVKHLQLTSNLLINLYEKLYKDRKIQFLYSSSQTGI